MNFEDWLDGRTIGYDEVTFGGWFWRGPGYDDGWESFSDEDDRLFRIFMKALF